MICPRCGSYNPDTNAFCTQCGNKLKVDVEPPKVEENPFKPIEPEKPIQDTVVLDPFFTQEEPEIRPPEIEEPELAEPDGNPFSPIDEAPEEPEKEEPAAEKPFEDTIVLDPFFPEDEPEIRPPELDEPDQTEPGVNPFSPINEVPKEPEKEEPVAEKPFEDTIVLDPFFPEDEPENPFKPIGETPAEPEKPAFEPVIDDNAKKGDTIVAGSVSQEKEQPLTVEEFLKDYLSDSTTKDTSESKPVEDNKAYTNILYQPPEEKKPEKPEPPVEQPVEPPEEIEEDPPKEIDDNLKKVIIMALIALAAIALIVYGIKLIAGSRGDGNGGEPNPDDEVVQDDDQEKTDEEGEGEEEQTPAVAEKVSASGLERSAYDINFSQAGDIDGSGVDFLIKINNSNDYAVNSVDFKFYQNDKAVTNTKDNTDMFMAYGYIKPHSTGYMYCRMHVPSSTERNRGKVKLKGAYKVDLGDYEIPYGTVEDKHVNGNKDYYDVEIHNDNSTDVSANAKVIVVCEGRDSANYPLADSWGCGDLEEVIGANDSVYLTDVIDNPGMSHYGENNSPVAFVIDRTALGISADE
ncbi:MAG: zinc ribbon domain-containing protein [Mogibacterium sp.]|nr:zinc ribbon domain-containing protein [Mogibacterium sp.]